MKCDYCGINEQASDYGACAECADWHDDNPTGPTLFRPDGSQIANGSDEYNFYCKQM